MRKAALGSFAMLSGRNNNFLPCAKSCQKKYNNLNFTKYIEQYKNTPKNNWNQKI
jgi:hypothetical protein